MSQRDEPEVGDTLRDYTAILENQLVEGTRTLNRPASGQFLSGLSCGFDLGLGPLFLIGMGSALGSTLAAPVAKFPMALMYTFGFVYVVLGRTELFTEHTTLAVLPVLAGEESMAKLARLWGVVWGGNILAGAFVAPFIAIVGPRMHVVDRSVVVDVAAPFIELSPLGVFGGALVAGWLMGLLSWILTSAGDTISRLVVTVLTTFLIGYFHLPHCVAGNIEVLAGLIAGADISYVEWARFLAVSTGGNIVGGVVFVSAMKFAHVVRGIPEPKHATVEQHRGSRVEVRLDTSNEED